jgi:predicted permease
LDGHPFQIVGVTEPDFFGTDVGRATQVYAPLCAEAVVRGESSGLDERAQWFLRIGGRRPTELPLEAVQARLESIAPAVYAAAVPLDWPADHQQNFLQRGLSAVPAARGSSDIRGEYRDALLVLMGVVSVVLLIACGNVANLLLARSATREREMEVRLALGAGRGRLVRQLLTESLLLSLVGAGLGILFGRWASELLVGLLSTSSDVVWLDLSLDGRVLGFTVVVAVATGVFFGLAPVWQTIRLRPESVLKTNVRGATKNAARRPLRSALVVGQVALSLVLVVAAALLLGTFHRLVTLDPGFQREGLTLVGADFEKLRLMTGPRRALQLEMLEQLRALPGVTTASASFITPISEHRWANDVEVPDYVPKAERDTIVYYNAVATRYFETMGTARLAGRDFDSHDGPQSTRVVAINEAMAQKFFGKASPLGRTFRAGEGPHMGPPLEIVAVVQDSKYLSLKEDPRPTVFFPILQAQDIGPRIHFVLRSDASPGLLIPAVSKLLTEMNPNVALDFTSLSEQVAASLTRPRLLALLSGFFGCARSAAGGSGSIWNHGLQRGATTQRNRCPHCTRGCPFSDPALDCARGVPTGAGGHWSRRSGCARRSSSGRGVSVRSDAVGSGGSCGRDPDPGRGGNAGGVDPRDARISAGSDDRPARGVTRAGAVA